MRKSVGWKLAGMALLVALTCLTLPATGYGYCCSCDYSNSYYYCYEGCGSDTACQNDCYDSWMAAEDHCIRTCPYGAVC